MRVWSTGLPVLEVSARTSLNTMNVTGARTVVHAEAGKLRVVDEVDEGHVGARRNALVQLPLGCDGVFVAVELGARDVRGSADVYEVDAPAPKGVSVYMSK